MRFFPLVALLAVPATVSACEGDCIVAITNAWLGNYTKPIESVMRSMAAQISDIIPGRPSEDATLKYLAPIMTAYRKDAYKRMETAIFPSYFHGKCLDSNGVTPSGCPNPDCPIVCGTPGSLVHFFPKLRYIAFNQTYHFLESLADPNSSTYQQVEKMVVAAASRKTNDERRRTYSRIFPRGADGVPIIPMLKVRSPDVKAGLKAILAQIHALLEETCGGSGEENTNGLPSCSWEREMKEYILVFP
ncbi:hypothetical protein C8Q80DRAFT_1094148 [Daedaleopsis nitida]|nr:hypothetical protein C8Q80DRAFT_1094148 [Daedaleopsis nitida]